MQNVSETGEDSMFADGYTYTSHAGKLPIDGIYIRMFASFSQVGEEGGLGCEASRRENLMSSWVCPGKRSRLSITLTMAGNWLLFSSSSLPFVIDSWK